MYLKMQRGFDVSI